MIITIGGFKGGIGKTTTAVHLACYFSKRSPNVLLVDGDSNRSATGWGKRGGFPFEVCDLMAAAKLSRGKDHIIIDTQGNPDQAELEQLAEGCDFLVLPTGGDALSLDALLQTVDALRGISNYGILLAMIDSRKRDTAAQAAKMLRSLELPVLKTIIRRFTAYERAALLGVPVYEVKGDRFSKIAWGEYEALGKEIESYA